MAKKLEEKKEVKLKKPQKQKIIVAQGRAIRTPNIPYKTLYTEVVSSLEIAKKRIVELKEEYRDIDGLSVSYFSL